jgi:hypothetical protein
MDLHSPLSKKRAYKKSTLKTAEYIRQVREDVGTLFKDLFDKKRFEKIEDLISGPITNDEHLATLIYLATHLLSPVYIKIFNIGMRIVPISISLTDESFNHPKGHKRIISPERIAVYFLHEGKEGIDFSTCLIGSITIDNKMETRSREIITEKYIKGRTIEF